jgi:two-component system sensor histidine kinase YesM
MMQRKIFYTYFFRLLVLSLLPIILLTLVYLSVSIPEQKEALLEEGRNNLALIQENISLLLNDSTKIMSLVYTAPNMYMLSQVLDKSEHNYMEYIFYKQLASQMNSIVNLRDYIDSIYVYIPNNREAFLTSQANIFTLYGAMDRNWLSACAGGDNYRLIKRQANLFAFITASRDYLTIIEENGKGLVVAVNVMASYFKRIFENLNLKQGQKIMILNRGAVLFSSDGNYDNTGLLDGPYSWGNAVMEGRHHLVLRSFSHNMGLEFISLVPSSVAYAGIYKLFAVFLCTAVVCILTTVVYSVHYASRMAGQLSSIVELMEAASRNRPLPEVRKLKNDVYNYILTNMMQTFVQNDYLKLSLNERRLRAISLELSALQYQMQPHFLLNTLQMINFEVLRISGKPCRANEMIEGLSRFLQYSLKAPDHDVRVEEETEATRYYTILMESRYGNRFRVNWEIAKAALSCRMPKFVLQPLIENSIRHGMDGEREDFFIEVIIHRDASGLGIIVRDNGRGLGSEQMTALRMSLMDFSGFNEKHIGLKNIFRRLNLRYEKDFKLILNSEPGKNFSVYIRLPLSEF